MSDERLKNIIKNNLNDELSHIGFSQSSRDKIIDRLNKKDSWFRRFLDYEIVIPIRPAIALVAMLFIVGGYVSYPMFKVDSGDILVSRIEIVKLEARK